MALQEQNLQIVHSTIKTDDSEAQEKKIAPYELSKPTSMYEYRLQIISFLVGASIATYQEKNATTTLLYGGIAVAISYLIDKNYPDITEKIKKKI